MNSGFLRYSILFVILIGLSSWGEKAHRKINASCVEFFSEELHNLKVWAPVLADHSSDADFLKKVDKTEFVKHFIDLDNYETFIQTHRIPENFDVACSKYERDFVKKTGTLPWSTDSIYQVLILNFKTKNWDQAVLTASNLGHYVADGFMPLHSTSNYDGQLSNQKGVHSRYEETMIDRNIEKIQISISEIEKVNSPKTFIFNYLYANNFYVDTLLNADQQAFESAGDQYNDTYYDSLWEKTNLFTLKLLEGSSKALAKLIYTAWCEAGSPEIPGDLDRHRN